jgi:capsular exopolysaccharide synthesis family protein
MSRLYETLKRLEDGRPGSILPAIDAGAPAAAPSVIVLPELAPAATARQSEPSPAMETPRAGVPDGRRSVRMRIDARAPLFPFDGSDTRASEQYRMLRTNLLQHTLAPHVIAISSGDSGDGKTVTAINIAAALALNNCGRVLLIDADMRRGSVARLLGVDQNPGLAQVLHRDCALDDAVVRLEQTPNLHLLPSGGGSRNPAELLESTEWRALLDTAREQFRWIVIDTTPVAAVADFDLVQSGVDGVLLVVRPEHTKRSALTQALSVVPKEKLLGVVINGVRDWALWKSYGHYYYYGSPKAGASKGDRS